MEVPSEIFESAVDACEKVDARGNPTRLANLLSKNAVLSFPDSKFLQLLTNSVQDACEGQAIRDH